MRLGKLILSFTLLVLFHFGIAQSRPSSQADTFIDSSNHTLRIYKLPANTLINNVTWRDSVYRFPTFEYGRITLATGFSPEDKARLNYNLYMGQMQLITNDGDTAYVKRLKEVKFISIADHLFYHDFKIGYIEIIRQSRVALAVQNIMITANWDVRNTTSSYDRYYVKKGFYYFLDKDSKSYKATSASIQKLFYDDRKKVKAYINENKIDFESQPDLLKLLTFCEELSVEDGN
jgi:hypothetical protein